MSTTVFTHVVIEGVTSVDKPHVADQARDIRHADEQQHQQPHMEIKLGRGTRGRKWYDGLCEVY